jgi:hypothetical protein
MIANKVTERNKLTNSVLTQIRKYEAMANFVQAPQLRFVFYTCQSFGILPSSTYI